MTKTGATATFTGNVNAGGLTINGTNGTLNLGSGLTHTISTTWTMTAGTLNGGSSSLIFGGAGVSLTSGAFTAATSTVNYNALGPQTVAPLTYTNLTLSGSGAKTIANSPVVTVNGILSMEGTATVTGSTGLIYGAASSLQYNTSTARNAGVEWKSPFPGSGGIIITNTGAITVVVGSSKTLNDGVPLRVYTGATLNIGTNTFVIGGSLTNNGTFTATSADITLKGSFTDTGTTTLGNSKITLDGASTQSIDGFTTTGSFTMKKPGGTATFDGNVSAGSLTLNVVGGTLNLGSGRTHTFNGSWTMSAGTLEGASSTLNVTGSVSYTGGNFFAGTSTVVYSGGSAQNIGSFTYDNLSTSVPSGSATKTTTGPVTVNGNLYVGTGSTLDVKGYDFTVAGTTIVNGTLKHSASGGTKTYTGSMTVNGTWDNSANVNIHFRGGFTFNGTSFPPDTGTYIFETNDQAVSGSVPFSINTLTINGITLTNNGSITVTADMNGTGSLVQGGGATLKIGGTLNVPLDATAALNTVNYSGASQTITSLTYYHLSTSGSGTKTLGGDVTLNGDLNVGSGTILTVPGVNFSVNGTTTVSGTLTHSDAAGTKTYAGLVTVTGTWNNTGNAAIHFHGGLTFSGGAFTAGTGMYTFDTEDQVIDGSAAFTISSVTVSGITLTNNNTSAAGFTVSVYLGGTGTIVQGAPNPTLNIGGTSSITLDASTVPNTVNYNGADQSVIATSYNDLTLSGSGVKNLSGVSTISGDFSLSGSASATTATNMTVGGNLTLRNTSSLSVAGYDFSITGTTHLYNASTLTHTSGAGAKSYAGDVTLESGTAWFDNSDVINISFGGGLMLVGVFQTGQGFQSGQGVHTFTGTGKVFSGSINIPNIFITGSYTNNGSLTAGSSLGGSGSLTQGAPNPILYLGGTATIASLTATANPNTVSYNMVGTQAIRSMTYYNLSTGGTNIKTLSGNVIVKGALTIGTNTTLDVSTSNYSIDLYGSWSNSGTFNAQAGTVNLLGSSIQTMSGSVATFYNLVVNNSAGITLSTNETINNILTLTSGMVGTGSKTLILGLSGSISGADATKYINGSLQKNFSSAPQTFVYDIGDSTAYTPVTLAVNSISFNVGYTSDGVIIKSVPGDYQYIYSSGLDPNQDINRYWTTSLSSIPALKNISYDATFTFVDVDKDPGVDPSIFLPKRNVSKYSWVDTGLGTRTANSTQATGITALGTFAVGEPDLTIPLVTGVTANKADGSYTVGTIIPIQVTFSEWVKVTGTPTITLHTAGSVNRVVNYSSTTDATVTFNYTVQAGDTSSDLDYLATDSLALNSGTIADYGGNGAVLTLPSPGAAGSISDDQNIIIDTTPPTVTNVDSTSPDGTYKNGSIAITVAFSEPVTVSTTGGTPSLTLETGLVDESALYTSGSGTATLTFTYSIIPGDNTPDLDYVNTGSLAANGGTIRDAAGNNATLTLSAPGAVGSLGYNRNIVIDTVVAVSYVTSTTPDGAYHTGTIAVTVTFAHPVYVTGTPTLILETGTVDEVAPYTSGSGTDTLLFTYTIQPGDTSSDLDYVGTTSLSGTIKDASAHDADLTLPAPGTAGSLGANKAIFIDTTAPTTSIDNPRPPAADQDTTPTFFFSGSDAGSGLHGFKCKVDGASYTDCTSPFTQNPALADGSHTFYVYAVDNAGNNDATPDTYTWTVDTLAPNTTITGHPAAKDNDSTPSFTFTGDDHAVGSGVDHYLCHVDAGAPSVCSSGLSWSTLSDGSHTFYVAAVDHAGNVDPTPDSFTWTIDTVAPDTTITGHPLNDPDNDNTPTFTFNGTDNVGGVGVDHFLCHVDSGAPVVCTSGVPWSVLADGTHTFYVAAVDKAGNVDPTPASFSWTVQASYKVYLPLVIK